MVLLRKINTILKIYNDLRQRQKINADTSTLFNWILKRKNFIGTVYNRDDQNTHMYILFKIYIIDIHLKICVEIYT